MTNSVGEPEATPIVLYDYWRSSASYRVRIALNLLALDYHSEPINLLKDEHKLPQYIKRNPQAIVPAIVVDGRILTQSLAIIEYLNETHPSFGLLPDEASDRAKVRALSYAIAMEIHPVCNSSIVDDIVILSGDDEETKSQWMHSKIMAGLEKFEACLDDDNRRTYCCAGPVSMADCCLIPQLYNARRWGVNYCELVKINAIEKACNGLPAFQDAHPDRHNRN